MSVLLRSPLIFPANNKRFCDKAIASDADAVLFDIEDAVPMEHKQDARDNTMDCLRQGRLKNRQTFIRINKLGTLDFIKDMEQLVHEDISGYLLTKIDTPEEISFIDGLCALIETKMGWPNGKIKLSVLIETAGAIANVHQIAHASKRLVALFFGGEDYLDSISSTYTKIEPTNTYPRMAIIVAARSAGLQPIDTPYLEVRDIPGFIDEKTEMYKSGFAGCLLLTPTQIQPAHACFSPCEEDVLYSRGLIEAIEEARKEKTGVVVYRGVMVGPPLRNRAEMILRQNELIERLGRAGREGA